MELKGSKTWNNLHAAWAGETQAQAKYTYFAAKARKEGYEEIARIFEETARNEHAHGKLWFQHMMDGIGETAANLENARSGEHYEWSEMYREFAKTAREEGFTRIAQQFEQVGEIERTHMERFAINKDNVEQHHVFEKNDETTWVCLNCGYIHHAKAAPAVCPVCEHPQSYFKEQTSC
ncbi:MAG: rubrerythrin family protein [Christensenellaceae bacterium]|nr:rubrerythrin family protein [Christensenellaceae bacterium]MBR4080139.1 rubrerythrin family protein [Christensenellaceae bacterium]